MKLHHIGYACKNIKHQLKILSQLYNIKHSTDIIYDALQEASVCLLTLEDGSAIELVEGKIVEDYIRRQINPYHVCYEVQDFEKAQEKLVSNGAILISEAKPAKLFDGRRVVFLQTEMGLVELLETEKHEDNKEETPLMLASTFTPDSVVYYINKIFTVINKKVSLISVGPNNLYAELLEKNSTLNQSQIYKTCLLVRLSDIKDEEIPGNRLLHALDTANKLSNNTFLIMICPSKHILPKKAQIQFIQALKARKFITLATTDKLEKIYNTGNPYSAFTEEEAGIPYTEQYDAVLAMHIIRKLYASIERRGKLIIVDADNTLWDGICAESEKITIDKKHLWLQNFLSTQRENGYMLCVASKNRLSDVKHSFQKTKNMVLKEKDISFWLVNWKKKSSNILNIANELNVAISDIVFIDDNIHEIEEAKQSLPEIMALHYTGTAASLKKLTQNQWLFDARPKISDAKKRESWYQNNKKRKALTTKVNSYAEYLSSICVKISINTAAENDYMRISELSYRVTQFNTSNAHFDENQLFKRRENNQIFIISAKDKYDDYGRIGYFICHKKDNALIISDFAISCRALNLKIEFSVLSKLKAIAEKESCSNLAFVFNQTKRNEPAKQFIHTIKAKKGKYFYTLSANTINVENLKLAEAYPQKQIISKTDRNTFLDNSQLTKISEISISAKTLYSALGGKISDYLNKETSVFNLLKQIWKDALGIKEIRNDTDFFESGGTSLSALRACTRLYDELQLYVPLYILMRNSRFSAFYRSIKQSKFSADITTLKKATSLSPKNKKAVLSENQKSLLYLSELVTHPGAYNIPLCYAFNNNINLKKLRKALIDIVSIHGSLRSYITESHNEYTLKNFDKKTGGIEEHEASSLTEKELMGKISQLSVHPFNLKKPPLFKFILFKNFKNKHILLCIFHHIIFDGYSIDIFNKAINDIYLSGKIETKHLPKKTYFDYTNWEYDFLLSEKYKSMLAFWKKSLQGFKRLKLPFANKRNQQQVSSGKYRKLVLAHDSVELIHRLAKEYKTTPLIVAYFCFLTALHYASKQTDITIGFPVNVRPSADYDNVIGNFINSLPIRIKFSPDTTIKTLISKCHEAFYRGYESKFIPFRKITQVLSCDISQNINPIFQYMLAYQDNQTPTPTLDHEKAKLFTQGYNAARLDLILEINNTPEGLSGGIYYNDSLFNSQDIYRLAELYETIFSQLNNINKKSKITALFPKKNTLKEINKNPDKTEINSLHRSFETIARLTPRKCAIQTSNVKYTYEQLNAISNQVARCLKTKFNIRENDIVSISLPKGVETIILILACSKLGATYLPLNLNYPYQYRNRILNECTPILLINKNKLSDILTHAPNYSSKNLSLRPSADYRSYIIYTSGSTGNPKGVQVGQKNILYIMSQGARIFHFNEKDIIPLFHSFSFDVSVWEIWSALLYGGTLFILSDDDLKYTDKLGEKLEKAKVTILNQTPSVFENILLPQIKKFPKLALQLRLLIFAGEKLNPCILKPLERLKNLEVYNLYGSTETTIHSTYQLITKTNIENNESIIGAPFPGTKIRILNSIGENVKQNEIGEIYISGKGLSHKYFNGNNQPFVSLSDSETYYQTGDLAKLSETGEIHYVGRKNNLIKFHGYRINLLDIESAALALPSCQHAIAFIYTAKNLEQISIAVKFIDKKNAINIKILREHLENTLPDYMLPKRFLLIDNVILNTNGKLDKKAIITELTNKKQENSDQNITSKDKLTWLIQTVKTILNINQVDINTNFVELGFDSFSLMKFLAKLQSQEPRIAMLDIFNHPTVSKLHHYICMKPKTNLSKGG